MRLASVSLVLGAFLSAFFALSASAASTAPVRISTKSATLSAGQPLPNNLYATVTEYYNSQLDHYFVTSDATEVQALDKGIVTGWARTGTTFGAFASNVVNTVPVCRFYGRPESGLDSHFYSASADECSAVLSKLASSWSVESWNVFYVREPDRNTGACPYDTEPVFRLFNNRKDANHRYTKDPSVRKTMMQRGYVPEGYGPDGVVFCAPFANTPLSARISLTPGPLGRYDFYGTATPSEGAQIVSYAWRFGDGGTASNANTSHQYGTSGNYTVTLTVTDSIGGVASTSLSIPIVVSQNTIAADFEMLQMTSDTFVFDAMAVASPEAVMVSYAWDFGDGSTASGQSVNHHFDSPGQYVITLTAMDSKGGAGKASKSKTVTDSASAPASTDADFIARRTSPGVFRWFALDKEADLGTNGPIGSTSTTSFGFASGGGPNASTPAIDSQKRALRLQVLPGSTNDGAGKWQTRFSDDGSRVFRSNSQFFVQWAFEHDGYYSPGASGVGYGPKFAYLGGENVGSTNEFSILVVPTYYTSGLPFVYTYVPKLGTYGLGSRQADDTFNLQTSCPYPYKVTTCIPIPANKKVYFQIGVQLFGYTTGDIDGTQYAGVDAAVKMWITIDGITQLIVDWGPNSPGYKPFMANPDHTGNAFSRIMFDAYQTSKDPTINHPIYNLWFSELILSTQRIPDPKPAQVQYPKWRRSKSLGTFFELPGTAKLGNVLASTPGANLAEYSIEAWNGLAAGQTSFYAGAAGGHGVWINPTFVLDLNVEYPTWRLLDPGSKESDVTKNRYYADGRPASRHTYYSQQFISAAHDSEGKDRLMLFGAFATFANDTFMTDRAAAYGGGPDIESFRITDRKWDNNKWPNMAAFSGAWSSYEEMWKTTAKHPVTEDVYMAGSYLFHRFNAKTGSVDLLLARDPNPAALNKGRSRYVQWADLPSLVDAKRNRFICLTDGFAMAEGPMRLEYLDLRSYENPEPIYVTGDLTTTVWHRAGALMHDTDNDRYIAFVMPQGNGSSAMVQVYEINPDTGVSRFLTTAPTQNPAYGIYNRAAYFPALGGIAYLPNFNSNVWFLPTR